MSDSSSKPFTPPTWRGDKESQDGSGGNDKAVPSWTDRLGRGINIGSGSAATALPPSLGSWCIKAFMGITVGLYILNQKHLLPKPLSRIVSKALFWPTLPITVGKRMGSWMTVIDDTVIMGGAPFGFAGIPDKLYREYGVRGVVNFCEEYKGPVQSYQNLGISHLYLPTADHFEPTVQDLTATVQFIQRHQAQGTKVYVHCRAGHGRSAAGVFAWLLTKDPTQNPQRLNEYFCTLRNVRKTLWRQANMRRFLANLKEDALDENANKPKDE